MLTEEQLRHYFREGYVLVEGFVPREIVDGVVAAADARVANDSGSWRSFTFDHEDPSKDADLHAIFACEPVVVAARQLLGNEPRLWYGMFAVVSPRGGHGLPWHQDNMYTQILGGGLNIFVALQDIDVSRAGLWVSPRSHRLGVQPNTSNDTTAPGHRELLVEPDEQLALPPMAPGDTCIFDRCTLHRSLQNESDAPRYAYAAQYIADHARKADDGEQPDRMRAIDLQALRAG